MTAYLIESKTDLSTDGTWMLDADLDLEFPPVIIERLKRGGDFERSGCTFRIINTSEDKA